MRLECRIDIIFSSSWIGAFRDRITLQIKNIIKGYYWFYIWIKKCLVFTWKMTTRPPLSPVAKSSPSWLNSTQDMISASVTSSSNAPLICEKHQDASPLPVKRNGKPKLYKIFLISCPHLPFSISIAKPNCLLHLISSRLAHNQYATVSASATTKDNDDVSTTVMSVALKYLVMTQFATCVRFTLYILML